MGICVAAASSLFRRSSPFDQGFFVFNVLATEGSVPRGAPISTCISSTVSLVSRYASFVTCLHVSNVSRSSSRSTLLLQVSLSPLKLALSVWIGAGATTVEGFNGTRGLKNVQRSWCPWDGLSGALFGPLSFIPCLRLQAFDVRWMARFFVPPNPTQTVLLQSGQARTLAAWNVFPLVFPLLLFNILAQCNVFLFKLVQVLTFRHSSHFASHLAQVLELAQAF